VLRLFAFADWKLLVEHQERHLTCKHLTPVILTPNQQGQYAEGNASFGFCLTKSCIAFQYLGYWFGDCWSEIFARHVPFLMPKQ